MGFTDWFEFSAATGPDLHADFAVRFITWAENQSDVKLVLHVGSRSRQKSDGWGDLDLVMFTTTPEAYLTREWLEQFGDLQVVFLDQPGGSYKEWMTVYAGGVDVDVLITAVPAEGFSTHDVIDALGPDVLRRGFRPLYDPAAVCVGLVDQLPDSPSLESRLPDQSAFDLCCNTFWRYLFRASRKLIRGEYWYAITWGDARLKREMVTMFEWHALAQNPEVDVWYDGRYIERWANYKLFQDMEILFARYDALDIRRAFLGSLIVFRRIAQETAVALNLDYDQRADDSISAEVYDLLGGKT